MQSHLLRVLVVTVCFQPCQFATERPTWIQAHPRVTHNASFNLKQKWYRSDKGAVNGWLRVQKGHIFGHFPSWPPLANCAHAVQHYALCDCPAHRATMQQSWHPLSIDCLRREPCFSPQNLQATHITKSPDFWCNRVLIINKHHCKRNGVKRSTSWECRPTYAVFPCKATFLGFWWSLWAFSPANLQTERPTWIQAILSYSSCNHRL